MMNACHSLIKVCFFTTCILGVHAGASVTVSPNNSKIQYTGRIAIMDDKALLYHSGAHAKVRFTGTSISGIFSDQDYGNDGNMVGYKIDEGDWIVAKLQNKTPNQTVNFASGLSDGEHRLMFMRETDVTAGTLTFHGFQLDDGASLLEPDPRPELRMEVYGNSVTSGGYGSESGEWSSYWAYHNRLGRKIGAEVQSVAAGGLGLNSQFSLFEYHNNSGTGLNSFYKYLQPNKWREDVTYWDFSRFQPHIIIFAIGANDHNRGVENSDRQAWQREYAQVVEEIVGQYPGKPVLVFTQAYGAYNDLDGMIAQVASDLRGRGYEAFSHDHDIHASGNDQWSVNAHPNAAGHAALADSLYNLFVENEIIKRAEDVVSRVNQERLPRPAFGSLQRPAAFKAYTLDGRFLGKTEISGSGDVRLHSQLFHAGQGMMVLTDGDGKTVRRLFIR